MGFKKIDNSINFCLLCIILFFGISQFLLINNFMNIPVKGSYDFIKNNPDYIRGFDYSFYYEVDYPDFWVVDLGNDHKITNIENIVIWIFMFWGFLRVIDLQRILENYKKDI